jgi:RNA polymerase sigma-70 factor, ECF subfamily
MIETADCSKLTDIALLRLIARAHAPALGELYDRYGRLVFSLALNVVGDQPTAEEITQDVFTSVWEKAATYRPEQSKVSTWLSSITRYRAIDILRRRDVRPDHHSVSWGEAAVEELVDTASTSDLAETAMNRQSVRAAIAALPPEQQRALALAYFRGFSHSEIATLLNEPLGTVKTRIRLAMIKLRTLLQEELGER